MKKPEILLPVWGHQQPDTYGYFDDREYTLDADVGSAWLSLRCSADAPSPYYSVMSHIGIYVWFSADALSFSLRLHDIHCLDLRQAQEHTKVLRELTTKTLKGYPMLDNFVREQPDMHLELSCLLQAMGVKRAREYRGVNTEETFMPVVHAVDNIAHALMLRINKMRAIKAKASVQN